MLRKVFNKQKNMNEWALVSESNPKKILEWYGRKRPSPKELAASEKRVNYFKHFGANPKSKVMLRRKDGVRQRYIKGGIVRKARPVIIRKDPTERITQRFS